MRGVYSFDDRFLLPPHHVRYAYLCCMNDKYTLKNLFSLSRNVLTKSASLNIECHNNGAWHIPMPLYTLYKINYVNMQYNYVNMQLICVKIIMFTCNIIMPKFEIIMLTCDLNYVACHMPSYITYIIK